MQETNLFSEGASHRALGAQHHCEQFGVVDFKIQIKSHK